MNKHLFPTLLTIAILMTTIANRNSNENKKAQKHKLKIKWRKRTKARPVAILTLFLLLVLAVVPVTELVRAQSTGSIIINSDGLVSGTNSILQHSGNVYTLTGNLSEGIQVQRSSIVIDGAGFAIVGADIDLRNGVGQDPSRPTIHNVVIINLVIAGGSIVTNGGGYNVFYNNIITEGIGLSGCCYNRISRCTINSIYMDYGASYNIITENNLNAASVFLSTNETVDKNYWSDYLKKYPSAKEISKTGIGDQPYVYCTVGTRTPTIYQDNHPLMKPVTVPLATGVRISNPPNPPTPNPTSTPLTPSPSPMPTSTLSPSLSLTPTPSAQPSPSLSPSIAPTATVPEFPAWLILPIIMAIMAAAITVRRKRMP